MSGTARSCSILMFNLLENCQTVSVMNLKLNSKNNQVWKTNLILSLLDFSFLKNGNDYVKADPVLPLIFYILKNINTLY